MTLEKYFDISVSIRPDLPVWDGDPRVVIRTASSIKNGDMANVSRLEIGAHTGTHIDAPIHFVPNRKGIDKLNLETLIGPAYIADLTNTAYEIDADDFEHANIPTGTQRVLCKTSNSNLWSERPSTFFREFIGISAGGAQWLINHGVKLVGVDYLGVERFEMVEKGGQTHHMLLEEDIVIVEGLDLSNVTSGEYTLICLPVKIQDGDGGPCRAILKMEG
ncbi:MAG: cyclase family protein [Anaerolineaceae bacterium]